MRMDLIDCFLMNPFLIGEQEYMRIHSQYVDQQFRHLYNLHGKIDKDGYVYCKIQLGMYGLKQAAILAYKLIKEILQPAGYYPIKESNRWQHKTRKKNFALCVDDFRVKYFNQDDALYLINVLQKHHEISIDWTGKNYCGLTLDWHYETGYVDVSMPGYVVEALQQFQHVKPSRPQHAPHKWNMPVYGQRIQLMKDPDKSNRLDQKGK